MKYLSKLDYSEQLKTSAWMRKKYEVMSRDNFVCSSCLADNFEKRLEVHHVTYIAGRLAWEYPDYLLVTLCRDCHQKEHDEKNTTKPNKIKKWIVRLLTTK